MTNREYYKEQILDIVCNNCVIAFDKKTNTLCSCSDVACENCLFNKNSLSCTNFKEWCNSEYVEPCPFEDGELVEVSTDGTCWNLRYFSHFDNNKIYKYLTYQNGLKSGSNITGWKYCQKYGTLGGLVKEENNDK